MKALSLLVVDDDPFLAMTMASSLKREFPPTTQIRTAHSVREALDWLAKETFHAVIADHELPDGKGIDLMKSLLLHSVSKPHALFLISGADPNEIEVGKFLQAHPEVTFIEKPFRFGDVAKRIRKVLLPEEAKGSDFFGFRLFDLIQAYSLARLSMTLRVIFSDGKMGVVLLREGRMIHAAYGQIEGEEALLFIAEAAEENPGSIRVEQGCMTAKESIQKPTQQVMLDTIRRMDERKRPGASSGGNNNFQTDLDGMIDEAFHPSSG